jgi:hypothetical protein
MTHFPPLALVALSLVLAACESPPKVPPSSQNAQLELKLANGTYNCEHKVRIQVEREIRDRVNYRITIGWNGSKYRLERDPSYSGLPRFEDSASGLVWIDMPWKSLLLDGKTNKPLVNECRPA